MEEFPPHVHAEAGQDRPLEDVGPRERVAAEGASNLDEEGGNADRQAEHESEMNACCVPAGQSILDSWSRLLIVSGHKANRTCPRGGLWYSTSSDGVRYRDIRMKNRLA